MENIRMLWFGSYHAFVDLAKFDRWEVKKGGKINEFRTQNDNHNQPHKEKSIVNSCLGCSYTSVLVGKKVADDKKKATKKVSMGQADLLTVLDSNCLILGCVRENEDIACYFKELKVFPRTF
ncbi:hypothetical protein L1987_57629 [Smallanthus sonchifolius]|uniref:Uncharacterized protein n=1 Tax=Smallanthus sonchifolius TaxID=185202 RepID=A0ACB9DDK9_9ASTR|nr:hypothetical protein L1987_57629 [Smallanthus sonchifolius]